MKTSLRLTTDKKRNGARLNLESKAAEKARMVALQKEQGGNLSPMDHCNSAKADRFAQGQADLEKIVQAAKPLVREPRLRAETQVRRAWTHASA